MSSARPHAAVLLVAAVAACAPADDPRVVGGPEPTPTLPSSTATPTSAPTATRVSVVAVPDGDTIRVRLEGADEPVRLIGVDAPEVAGHGGEAECFGAEAQRFVRRLVESAHVRLEFDRSRRDQYDRLLAYVHLDDGRMLNVVLLRRGYAITTDFPHNDRYRDELRAAERRAAADGAGLWSACP